MAPTGSGKTEAAVLPILENALEKAGGKGTFALYVTPLRALNRDMMKRLSELCSELGISIGVRHGDTPQSERRKQALSPPVLMITTPESIQNMLMSRRLRKSFENLRYVVVDELHELYHNKRGAQLSVALERLAELSPEFARVGLSATVGDAKEAARFLFNGNPYKAVESGAEKKIEVSVVMPIVPKRGHGEFEATFEMDDASLARIEYLEDVIKGSKATLVFANTRQVVESLGSKIIYLSRLEGFDYVGIHHSSLDKEERIEIENTFKSGKINCIVATSSLELGIDIGRIDMVVQYGSPRQAARLLQRIGRGGHREGEVSHGSVVVSGVLEALESTAAIIAAKEGRLEEYKMEEMALDVLANQLSGMALEYRELEIGKAYGIFKRSAVYSKLGFEKFMEVVNFCSTIGTVRTDGKALLPGRRTRNYSIENISVIPDSRRFAVRRASTNRIISTLDERFVYSSIDEESTFITKGVPWKVISIEDDVIFVEQSNDIGAAIPDWEGEDLPVPRHIAQKTMDLLADCSKCQGVVEPGSMAKVVEFSEKQRSLFLPARDKTFIEELDDYVVIYSPQGTLANEFIARMIALYFRERGEEAQARSTPYAVIIDIRYLRKKPDISRVIAGLWSAERGGLDEALADSSLFRYRFAQVAKLFGVIEKKAVLTRNKVEKIIGFYRNSVVYEEAMRDVKKNGVDYAAASEFLGGINSGAIKLAFARQGSQLSREVLRSALSHMELLTRTEPGSEDVAQVMKKFDGKEVRMLCTYCMFSYQIALVMEKLTSEKILCKRCKSPMMCTYSDEYYNALEKRKEGRKLTKAESESYRQAISEAGLVDAYGGRGILALLTYGVGISTAGRVLKMMRKDDKVFVEDLLRAQRTFIRNSRFWK